MTSIRSFLALVAARQWPLYQMSVEKDFVNGDLSEVIYKQPSPTVTALPEHVCRL